MITMDVKGITWVGNIYQKFENMCLEAEDMMYEDTAEYIENQMQSVGASVKKLYSDIVGDLLPSIACGLDEKEDSELPADQCTDAGLRKKPVKIFKERSGKANIKQKTEESRIDKNADNDSIHDASYDGTYKTDVLFKSSRNYVKKSNFISRSRQYVGSMDIKSNLGFDENPVNEKMAATKISNEITSAETKIFNEITSAETDTCRPLQHCEISNEDQNQNHGAIISKPALAEVASLASEADHCNEIENACTEQFPYVLVQVKSNEEKQTGTSSSCGPFGEPNDFSMDRTIQSDDCSNGMVVISYPEQRRKSMQEDHLKLEETCVMVTGDDLQEIGNLKTNKKTRRRQGFSLSKKSARKQEYEELAIWHGNNCLDMVNNNLDKTLHHKKLLVPSVSESEWELL